MRWIRVTATVFAVALLGAAPAHASAATGSGWTPAPSSPFDAAAGELCNDPIHAQPIVDQVRTRPIDATTAIYAGRLVVRVTDTVKGTSYDADASGTAVISTPGDGSQTWYVLGPVLAGFRVGQGNIPRGLWILDGAYRLAFDPTGHRVLTPAAAAHINVCEKL